MYVVWSCYSFFLLFTFIVLKMVFEVGIYLNSNRWCCCCCRHCNYYFYLLFIHVSEKKNGSTASAYRFQSMLNMISRMGWMDEHVHTTQLEFQPTGKITHHLHIFTKFAQKKWKKFRLQMKIEHIAIKEHIRHVFLSI